MCFFAAVPVAAAGAAASSAAAGTAATVALGSAAGAAASMGATAAATTWAVSPLAALGMNAAMGASLLAGLATPIMGYITQSQMASSQSDYQNRMYSANQAIAEQSLASQYSDISRRQQEESKKASQEMQVIARQSAEARSAALVSSIEGGVSGLSVDSLMSDYYRKEADYLNVTQQQQRANLFQMEQAKMGARAEFQGRVLSATPQPVQKPSLLATGLSIGGNVGTFATNLYLNPYSREIMRTRS
jgi:hypothetical protein